MVGYAKTATTAKKYNCIGSAFITAGADGTFKLKDYVPTGFNYANDECRVIDSGNGETTAQLVYIDEAHAAEADVDVGWYDFLSGDPYGDVPLALGTGFLTSFGTSTEVSFQNSGEVYREAPTIDCRGNKYQVIPNPLPRRVQIKEITIKGFNYANDELRVVDPTNGETVVQLVYIDEAHAEEAGVDVGWYDFLSGNSYDDEYMEIGAGFLMSSGDRNIQITFPKAIK